MNKESILASAISEVPHMVAFDLLIKKRFGELQLEKLLVYMIDTVDSSALPFLADQFDVLGYKGMKLAVTEEQQREVIKKAILLKRHKGTVWAVKESLRSIGYPDANLIEHAESGPNGWATFRIELAGGDNAVSASQIDELVKMITEYKNERSHLVDLSYTIDFDPDVVTIIEDSFENPSVDAGDTIKAGGDFRHNGVVLRNGTRNYSSDSDLLEIEILSV